MNQIVFDENDLYDQGCIPAYWYNSTTCERIPYYCGRARCFRPECLKSWATRRLAICNDLIRKIGRPRFFTLTIDRSHTVSEAWDMIAAWWAVFRHKIRRWLEKLDMPKMKYFAVLEAHKDGYPHIHGFWNFYIKKSVLSQLWSECAPGYIVDVQAVDNEQMASDYLFTELGKYLGKAQSINGARMAGHRKRTFWRSKGLYTDYELDRQEPGLHNGEWTLVMKGGSHAKKKQSREDLEGTYSADTKEGTGAGSPDMEAKEPENERPENKETTGSEGENKPGDTERKGEIDYGISSERQQEYTFCAESGGTGISDGSYQELSNHRASGRNFANVGEQ